MDAGNSRRLCAADEKRRLEVQNLESAFDFVTEFSVGVDGRRSPCTLAVILELHGIVISGIYPCAGSLRDAAVIVMVTGAVFSPTPAFRLQHQLDEMLERGRAWSDDWSFRQRSDLAADTLHAFNAIHPFRGGNGRVSRLLLHLMLYEMQLLTPPEQIFDYIRVSRSSYIAALQEGDRGDLQPIRNYVQRGIVDVRFQKIVHDLEAGGVLVPLMATIRKRELRRLLSRPHQAWRLPEVKLSLLLGELQSAVERFSQLTLPEGDPKQ